MAAGSKRLGTVERPMAWLSNGYRWQEIDIPVHLEGVFTGVANNEVSTVFVGYDTLSETGMIVRVERGGVPQEIPFDRQVDLFDVVTIDGGFAAYGIANPLEETSEPLIYTSADGIEWRRADAWFHPLVSTVEVHPDGWILEIDDLTGSAPPTVRTGSDLLAAPASDTRMPVSLEEDPEAGEARVTTATPHDGGYLLGGILLDRTTGAFQPGLWQTRQIVAGEQLVASRVPVTPPDGTRLFSGAWIKHLAQADGRTFVVATDLEGVVELWSTSDLRTWRFEETIGSPPTARTYRDATSEARAPGAQSGEVATLLLTNEGLPSDVWRLGEAVSDLSQTDLLEMQPHAQPLFVGVAGGSPIARIIDHAPRTTQSERDQIRSRVFSRSDDSWVEIAATNWGSDWRIQAILGDTESLTAFGTYSLATQRMSSFASPLTAPGLSEPTQLDGSSRSVLFGATNTSRATVAIGSDPRSSGHLTAWTSTDLNSWQPHLIPDSGGTRIGAVCGGLDKVWVAGMRFGRLPSTGRVWQSPDGLSWSDAAPATHETAYAHDFSACGGDSDRVVLAARPSSSLLVTTDGAAWDPIPSPPLESFQDEIVEVAVEGQLIAVVVRHPVRYLQPAATAWVWDGAIWHDATPEEDAVVASVSIVDGELFLSGTSPEGATIWSHVGIPSLEATAQSDPT
jgi:hypothetical protein